MKRFFLYTALCLLGCPTLVVSARADVTAQTTTGTNWRIGWLMPVMSHRDEALASIHHVGAGTGFRIGLNARRARGDHDLAIDAWMRLGTDRFGTLNLAFALEGTYDFWFAARGWKWGRAKLRLGPTAIGRMLVMHHYFWDDAHLYHLTGYGGGGGLRLDLPRPRGALDVSLRLPVVGIVSRPPLHRLNKIDRLTKARTYLGQSHTHFKFAHPGNWLSPGVDLGWTRKKKRGTARVALSTEYMYAHDPAPIHVLREKLVLEWMIGASL